MNNRLACITSSEIAHEVVVMRMRLERLRVLLDVQERQFANVERRAPITAGDAAARRLRAMKRARI